MIGCEVKLALRAGKKCLRFAARDPCRMQLEQTPSHGRHLDQFTIVGFQMIERLVDAGE
jgi:hypothetical protein